MVENSNTKSKKEKTKEYKQIAYKVISDVYLRYPSWKDEQLVLPSPIYPSTLDSVDLTNKQMAQVPFDDIRKSVLCGTIIGDTSLSIEKKYKNARFQSKHSTRQAEWFTWKFRVLLKELTNESGVIFTPPDGYQAGSPLRPGENVLGKLKIHSKAHVKLTELHKVICVNNRKKMQRSWLNHMNNYFLMTVWLDDGSLYNGRQGQICFNSVPVAEQNIFRAYLQSVWNINTKLEVKSDQPVLTNGQTNYVINIQEQESLKRLLRLVAPVVPVREMLYKVCFCQKEPSELERWKTELLNLVRPEFKQDVMDFYLSLPCSPEGDGECLNQKNL
ncbi:MAG: hypothetical protein IM447_09580 [Microcystis sp. M005S1]|nr:hypothetical protein [Microcystis sp. M005S1]MCA2859486.1 hypothetical protein [Microcystis sp. M005S1]